ncbi:NAD(P)/FAD-dependent oxidoreductase [soil metagenome]
MAQKKIIIVGAGFGGLQAVKKLSKIRNISITLIDRTNHHLFQPLLYQVATAVLNPADIAIPIRSLTHNYKNVEVIMGNVTSIDKEKKKVIVNDEEYSEEYTYDYLIVAAGSQTGYFGHNEWKQYTTPLKNILNALECRKRILLSYEEAEKVPEKSEVLLRYIIIGGGPTGVELAGSIGELSNKILSGDFRRIDTSKSEIVLIEGGADLLPAFDRQLSFYTKKQLEDRGVTVMLNTRVLNIDENGILISQQDGERIIRGNLVVWAAGVEANPLGKTLSYPTDRSGRVIVNDFCSFDDHPEIFVIGDLANFTDKEGNKLPGLSPVAMQQGRYAAEIIKNEINKEPNFLNRRKFVYLDKGSMAAIGRKVAIAQIKDFKIKGFFGWLAWLFIHLYYQVGFKNRFSILISWIWSYLTFKAGSRLIQEPIDKI